MVVTYGNGIINVVLEDDEIETGDFIFAQASASDLVKIQFQKMFNQRKLQQKEELKEQLYLEFTASRNLQKVKE